MGTIRETYLARLNNEFRHMIDLMLHQLHIAKEQLNGSSADELMQQVEENEKNIDRMQVKLRDDIVNCIVLQAPRAGDLRRIISYYDTVVDVERIADLLQSINGRMHYLQKPGSIFPLFKNKSIEIFDMAAKMTKDAIFAFFNEDPDLARQVIKSDEQLDNAYSDCHKELFNFEFDKKESPQTIADLLDIARLYYGMERIGDFATNIAEATVFLTKGVDVMHEDEQ